MTQSTDSAVTALTDFASWCMTAWSDRLGALAKAVTAPDYTADAAAKDGSDLALLAAGSAASLLVAVVDAAAYLTHPRSPTRRVISEEYGPIVSSTWPLVLELARPMHDELTDVHLPVERVTLVPDVLSSAKDTFHLEVGADERSGTYDGDVEVRTSATHQLVTTVEVTIAV